MSSCFTDIGASGFQISCLAEPYLDILPVLLNFEFRVNYDDHTKILNCVWSNFETVAQLFELIFNYVKCSV